MSRLLGRGGRGLARVLPGTVVVILLLVVWEIASQRSGTPFFPSLARIADGFERNWLFDRIPTDVVPSLGRLATGYALSLVIGVVAGIAIGSVPWVRVTLMPIVEFLRSLPSTSLVPFAIIAFGIGDTGKIFLILLGSTWPVLLNTASATANIDPVRLDAARVYRLSRATRIRKVLVPAATPAILAGARTSLAIALIMTIVSEMFASTSGLGHFVVQAQRTFKLADMWSGVVLIGILGFGLSVLFSVTERLLLRRHGQPGRGPATNEGS